MRKRLILIIIVLVAVFGGIYVYRGMGRQPENGIKVSGNIELNEVNIAFKTAGRLVERNFDEGDAVKQGDVIARLDREQLEAQRKRESAGLATAEAQLAQAETAVEWQKATVAADVDQRKADLSSAEARFQELKTGARPEELRQARAAAAAAQAEAERARRDWERAQVLYKNDDISTAQYDQFRSRWEGATASLQQAKEQQALVEAGPRREVIEAAAGQAQRANAALRVAEANTLELKRRQQEITARRSETERARANLALIDTQLADTVAVSPVTGVVLVKAADPGEIVAPGTSVLTIGDVDHPWLRGYVNETDLGRIKIGTPVRVTTDSYPGKSYRGRITFISSEAEFTPKQIQTAQERVKLVYRVKIEVENPNRELKSNMPADAEIVLQ
jgi:HlyD family secretion protein